MRILYISDAGSTHTRKWAEFFAERGHEVHVASFRQAEISGAVVHRIGNRHLGKFGYAFAIRQLRELARRISPDICHAQFVTSYGFVASMAGLHPLVVTAWGSDVLLPNRHSGVHGWLNRRAIAGASWVTAVASHMLPALHRLGAAPSSSEAIPFGVDLTVFHGSAPETGLPQVDVVSTRNFEPIYDVQTFIEALAILKGSGHHLRCDLVGGGSMEPELRAKVNQSGLAEAIEFRGRLTQAGVAASLRGARIFVTTALSDGNNVSLNEAMASGCIPVATRIPANAQWIRDGENGFLFHPGDAADCARAITAALEARPRWVDIREENRCIVEDRGDWNANAVRMADTYERLVGR